MWGHPPWCFIPNFTPYDHTVVWYYVVILIVSFTISFSSDLTGDTNMRSSHLMCHSNFLPPVTSLVSDMRSSYIMFHTQFSTSNDLNGEWHEVILHDFHTKFKPPMTSVVSDMRSTILIYHTQYLPPVTSLVSDMRSNYFMFHTVFLPSVTSLVSDMRSS
jgi:hypothetical protein